MQSSAFDPVLCAGTSGGSCISSSVRREKTLFVSKKTYQSLLEDSAISGDQVFSEKAGKRKIHGPRTSGMDGEFLQLLQC